MMEESSRFSVNPVLTTPQGLGPNPVLAPKLASIPKGPTKSMVMPKLKPAPTIKGPTRPVTTSPSHLLTQDINSDLLWDLLVHTYQAVNRCGPDLTQSCWLCYNTEPPYYDGVATMGNYIFPRITIVYVDGRVSSARLTLQSVTGQGTGMCTRDVAKEYKVCNLTQDLTDAEKTKFPIPPTNIWWAYSTGLTPCALGQLLQFPGQFCILVLTARLTYHSGEDFASFWDSPSTLIDLHVRTKRESIYILMLAVILGSGAAGVGTGISSLVLQDQHYRQLRESLDEDVSRLETVISHLQDSLSSLAEVVLLNRRGLDLLFLQQGGLCAALKEECCFYRDYSGIVKNSMAEVREGLGKRKTEWGQSQS